MQSLILLRRGGPLSLLAIVAPTTIYNNNEFNIRTLSTAHGDLHCWLHSTQEHYSLLDASVCVRLCALVCACVCSFVAADFFVLWTSHVFYKQAKLNRKSRHTARVLKLPRISLWGYRHNFFLVLLCFFVVGHFHIFYETSHASALSLGGGVQIKLSVETFYAHIYVCFKA